MAGNWRVAIAFTLIGAMLVALVYLLINDGDSEPDAATTLVTLTTTTTTAPPPTTTTGPTTTTTVDPEVRKAEVARILEDLELARLVAIYDKDEDALLGIVATQPGYDSAVAAMETLDFLADPADAGIEITVLEVLLDRADCLVVHHEFDGRASLGDDAISQAVRVMWPRTEGGIDLRLARLWSSPADLWMDDCDLMVRTDIP